MPSSLKYYILCLVVGLWIPKSIAQHYEFTQFNNDNIPSSHVFKLHQDRNGYLWILTQKGIARYDGKNVKTYSEKNGYKETGAYLVREDKNGVLWFITTNFQLYYFLNNRFYRFKTDKQISWIDIDDKGDKFVLTRDLNNNIFKLSDFTLIPIPAFATDRSYNLFHVKNDVFLVSSHSGLYLQNSLTSYRLIKVKAFHFISTIRIFKTSNRWFATSSEGIFEIDVKNKQIKLLYKLNKNEIFDMEENPITKDIIFSSANGVLWFRNGIIDNKNLVNLLNETNILSIATLNDQTTWFATKNQGIIKSNLQSLHYTKKDGLLTDEINSVSFHCKSVLAFSMFTSFNTYYDVNKASINKKRLPIPNFAKDTTLPLSHVNYMNDTLLYVTTNGGAAYTIKNFTSKYYALLYHYGIYNIGSPHGGLVEYDSVRHDLILTNKRVFDFTKYKYLQKVISLEKLNLTSNIPISINYPISFYNTNKGLLCMNYDDKGYSYQLVKIPTQAKQVLLVNSKIYISTITNGIYIHNNKSLTHISQQEGLPSNYVSKIYYHNNFLWACTNRGLARISTKNLNDITVFTSSDYLINNEINDVCVSSDTIYVASQGGISKFYAYTNFKREAPIVFIQNVQINNRDTNLRNNYTLPYDLNNFAITLSSPNIRSGNSNLYRLIINSDKASDTTYYQNELIQLSMLPPGNYSFDFNVRNIDGLWSNIPAKFKCVITPPFWKQKWFIALVSVIFGIFVWLIISRYVQLQKQKRKLAESELKSLRIYMNPHFIFNSLTSLQSFVLTHKSDDALLFITKFSKLIRAIMNYSVKGELSVAEEVTLLHQYIELEQIRFSPKIEYTISVDHEIDQHETLIPSLLIQPFVENAIKHGLTHLDSDKKRILTVDFVKRLNNLHCIITDNGVGRNSSNKDKLYPSTGIAFTEERIRLIEKNLTESAIKITDLGLNDITQTGTKVDILVPILNND